MSVGTFDAKMKLKNEWYMEFYHIKYNFIIYNVIIFHFLVSYIWLEVYFKSLVELKKWDKIQYCLIQWKRYLFSRLYETVLEFVHARLWCEEVVAPGLFVLWKYNLL